MTLFSDEVRRLVTLSVVVLSEVFRDGGVRRPEKDVEPEALGKSFGRRRRVSGRSRLVPTFLSSDDIQRVLYRHNKLMLVR